MRFYTIVLNANADMIEDNATIRLRDYEYDNPIGALNKYMHVNLDNGFCFFSYREEGDKLFSVMAFDEKRSSFENAYSYITDVLSDIFQIRKVMEEASEITMLQFRECYMEARRRQYSYYANITNDTNTNWLHERYMSDDRDHYTFTFDEILVPDKIGALPGIYDKSIKKEVKNIRMHENTLGKGNPVHYVISGRSIEAAREMIGVLAKALYDSKRIGSRRVEIITEIDPEVYKRNNHLEEIIESNSGGTIVFDLTESFGKNPTDYNRTSKYIEKLLKQYRNQCLFIFTYNIDDPGFSFQILPGLKKLVIPVMLREGSGDRKAALEYMKRLIKNSEYAEYACQAKEFMELFPGDVFSQTDVLMAYEQFEAWCINKNVLTSYDFDITGDFMMDRDENCGSSYDRLNSMIGLENVKKQIDRIIALDIVEKERKKRMGRKYQAGTMHMVFAGNPGTAKTTVARLFAGIAKEKGILKSGAFVQRGGMDLDGPCCVYLIRDAFEAAKGGVLFIDEAYSLKSDTAASVLIQEMENRRDDVIVILAGYSDRMDAFMEINEGLKSRVPFRVEFPDYTADELSEIFDLMMEERGFSATEAARTEAHYIFEKMSRIYNFGNGRYVRNLIDNAVQNQSERLYSGSSKATDIDRKALFLIEREDICSLSEDLRDERPEGTAKKELAEMIGLESAKDIFSKAVASYKLNKLCLEKGIERNRASLHMVFTGNPGTAKTTVARLLAEIMKDEKILSTGNFVEAGRGDLVGQYIGSTAPQVKQKFREAQGGVLFIDEAYSLCDDRHGSYGDEAINTIVQEMENHRDDLIVIFAGYPEPMKEFLDRNPGMKSRIAFNVEFEDYSTDELCDITTLMLLKKKMSITDAAMEKLRQIYDFAREQEGYGNGRFVRKMLEEAEMNLANRLITADESELTTELISTLDVCDIPEAQFKEKTAAKRIGFAC